MTIGDLRQKQALPLEAKIIASKQRIKEWYEYWNGDVYISNSGGVDSTVLLVKSKLHLFKNIGLLKANG